MQLITSPTLILANMINKDYITLQDYATKKNKSLKTIYNWIKAGKLIPVKIGKHQYIKS